MRDATGKNVGMYKGRLNEVRPRRPEQFPALRAEDTLLVVSMKSGLEGRNNSTTPFMSRGTTKGLNEVRPRRPEQ